MNFKRICTILTIIICMLVSTFSFAPVYAFQKGSTTAVTPLSDSSAYVIFSSTPKTKNMTFKDGMKDTTPTPTKGQELYYEKVTIDGVEAMKIYSGGYIYFSLDKSIFSGKKMLIVVNYYDFGPDEANIGLQYSSSDTSVSNPKYKELVIRKTGMEPGWKSVSFEVDDAAFSGAMNYGCDIRIRSGAFNAISKIEVMDYSKFTHVGTKTAKYNKSIVSDSTSGRTSYYMDFFGKPAIRPYVTAQGWNYEGTKFIFGSYNPVTTTDAEGNTIVDADSSGYRLYEYDIINDIIRQIDDGITSCVGGLNAYVAPDDYIYYSKKDTDGDGRGETWRMNWLTYEKEKLVNFTNSTMNVTNDGKYMSGYSGKRTDLSTGASTGPDLTHVYDIWQKTTYLPDGNGNIGYGSKGHPMVNPEYPNLLFFCHEGTTEYIHDRLWVTNLDTGESYNMFVQAPYSTEITAETSGHEVWSMDGEMMYWVKYASTNNVGQSGLMRTDRFGSNREYLNGDYGYWHCSPAGNHVWVVSDTNIGQIVLVNANTYSSRLISKFEMYDWVHPNQPHPHISYNAHAVSWQMKQSLDAPTGIGWQIVRDLTAHPASRQEIEFTSSANVITCKGSANYTTAETVNNVSYRKAASNCGVFIDIPNSVVKSTNTTVSLQISYLDKGTNPLKLVYTSPVTDVNGLSVREDKTYSISKSNSNTNKTVTVNLNMNANDAGRFRSDFYLTSADGAYISSVKASVTDPTISENEPIAAYTDIHRGIESGLEVTGLENTDSYNNTLYHIDETSKWQAAGITQETVDAAKAAGYSYVTLNVDGAWMYAQKRDNNGVLRKSVFAPKNYRQSGSYKTICGNAYFKLTNNNITENDKNVTFNIDYLDAANKITVTYVSTASNGLSSFKIGGGGTNLWKRATVSVADAKMSSTNRNTPLGCKYDDIKIESSSGEMYISGVSVSKAASTANSGIVTNDIYYTSYGIAGSKTQRINAFAEEYGETANGLESTSIDSVNYDNTLFHVSDTDNLTAEGFTQAQINAAINAGANYITKRNDGAWSYNSYKDNNGVTKPCFWSPRNYRPSASNSVNSGMYFRVTDDTITADDNELIFVIEYLDTDVPMQIAYTSTAEGGISSFYLPAGKTYCWRTVTVMLTDAALSSTNIKTKLATGTDDIKVNARGADMYLAGITVMKKADNISDADIYGTTQIGENIPSNSLASTTATVTSSMNTATTVVGLTAVYGMDGTLKQVSKSPYTNIAAGGKATLNIPEVVVSTGETYRTFVWESNFAPVVAKLDVLKTQAVRNEDGTISISWDANRFSGNFFHIYCDGKLVARTRSNSSILYKIPSGSHEYIIDVVEPYGKTVYRQRGIVVPD